jgi:hypothetical protein
MIAHHMMMMLLKDAEKTKMSKDECESFYNEIKMTHLTLLIRGKTP